MSTILNPYTEKIQELSRWYQYVINKNRLLLTVECSQKLQDWLFSSTVLDIYSYESNRCSLVLTSPIAGLWQLEFYLFQNVSYSQHINLKPFTGYNLIFETFLEIQLGSKFKTKANNPNVLNLDSGDDDVVAKVFGPFHEYISGEISDAALKKNHFIREKVKESIIGKSVVDIIENKRGHMTFKFNDGSEYPSVDAIHKKLYKEHDAAFLKKHSNALEQAKSLRKALDTK